MKLRNFIKVFVGIVSLLFFSNLWVNGAVKDEKLYIIEGLFFNELPVEHKDIKSYHSLCTSNDSRAMGLLLKTKLSDEGKSKAIPSEMVKEADILLDMYNERINSMNIIYSGKAEKMKVGNKFPEFKCKDIEGREWSNSDLKDKIVVLNCWFTGCGPCRAEMPELSEWRNEMPDVIFLSSTYERPEIAGPVLEKTGFNWIHLVEDKVFKTFTAGEGYPMTVVADGDGNIVYVEYGTSSEKRAAIKTAIESLRLSLK